MYLKGMLHRNVPTDLDHGHMQTLFGMQSMETIHDDVIHEVCQLYSRFQEHPEEHKAALRKWADVQIANGAYFVDVFRSRVPQAIKQCP